ncbi:MAG TPA: UDP-N-acetylmuramate--L-alanine ligase [Candidatus Baltobacteraceae bacterium]|nr:UDP-N-acetylmuramate--L-alanine ligase [Candidatus Baltobacteraceae bacterium]
MPLDLDHLHRVHCVGIGGIGVSAAAKLLRLQGKEVSGSDGTASIVTADAERAGIRVLVPSSANIDPDLDLLIYTSAAPETQIERVEAARLGIPQMSYFEFLGLVSQGYRTVAVCGTNGKSTTTAMLALILERAGLDPTVIVGSRVPSFAYGNFRPGKGAIFVVEACEYRAQFLHLQPSVVLTTKIAEDHLDYYRDLAHIQETFRTFAAKLPPNGPLIWNADDEGSRVAYAGLAQPNGTFGFSPEADLHVENYEIAEGVQRFDAVFRDDVAWRGLELRVPGAFNVSNALAALGAARALGVEEDAARAALADFTGIWRRFEKVGERDGAPVISDYGHTPDAVEATLKAAREFFPGRKVILAFQPHHHDRTRKLFDAFVASFDGADALILCEIYGVAGRAEGEGAVSSRALVDAVRERGAVKDVRYAAGPQAALAMLEGSDAKDAIMLVMGAGDIYSIAYPLCRTNP